ncbi:MAG: class I SAM-dependent methyltransferase [Candidatus Dojkabacteria bacterium]
MNPNDVTSKFYDIVSTPIKGREITDSEIALISSIVPSNSQILDIGAGTGRHLIPLSELGYNVTGIDSSHGMLDILEEKIKNKSNTKIIRADVLTHNFNSQEFDLIIMMWNSFNEIALNEKDAQRLLTIFGKILKTGGKVLINSDNPEVTKMDDADYNLNYSKDGKQYDIEWKAVGFDQPKNITTYREVVTSEGKKYQTEIKQKWWTKNEYRSIAEMNGFKFEELTFEKNKELYIALTKI